MVSPAGSGSSQTRYRRLALGSPRSPAISAAATARLAADGLATRTEENTACCYAVQDKVWVTGPGDEPWEVYTVKGDADTLDRQAGSTCCAPVHDQGGVSAAAVRRPGR